MDSKVKKEKVIIKVIVESVLEKAVIEVLALLVLVEPFFCL